jgi:hypothetical protein
MSPRRIDSGEHLVRQHLQDKLEATGASVRQTIDLDGDLLAIEWPDGTSVEIRATRLYFSGRPPLAREGHL